MELAATLLLVGATFFVLDGLQSVALFCVRGMKDTQMPLLFAALSYWLVGFTSAYLLAFWTPLGAVGRLDRVILRPRTRYLFWSCAFALLANRL